MLESNEDFENGLSVLVGLVLEVLFEQVPPVASWYAKLTSNKKRKLMLFILIAISVARTTFLLRPATLSAWLLTFANLMLRTATSNQISHLLLKSEGLTTQLDDILYTIKIERTTTVEPDAPLEGVSPTTQGDDVMRIA